MDKDLNFRHIIKTFVPGLFASISLLLIFDLLVIKLFNRGAHDLIKTFIERNSTLVVSLFIPISLFVGIIINTLCFVYLIPWILDRHKKNDAKFERFSNYKDSIHRHLSDYYNSHLFGGDANVEFAEFSEHFDVGSFLLHRKSMASLQYIKTGYWYYLEFQLNSIISIIFGVIAIDLNLALREIDCIKLSEKIIIFASTLFIGLVICRLLYKAIIKNLERDQKKELSYILGAYHICRVGKFPI